MATKDLRRIGRAEILRLAALCNTLRMTELAGFIELPDKEIQLFYAWSLKNKGLSQNIGKSKNIKQKETKSDKKWGKMSNKVVDILVMVEVE